MIINVLKNLSCFINKIAIAITGILLVFLTVLIFSGVVANFAFGKPLEWQYETTLVCLSWVVFIGMSMTFAAKEHMALKFVVDALKPKTRAVWTNVIDVLLIIFLIIGVVNGISVTQSTWGTFYQTIPVSRGIFYVAFPIGAAFSIVHLMYQIATCKASDFN